MRKVLYTTTAILAVMFMVQAAYAQPEQDQGPGGDKGGMMQQQDPQSIANRKVEEELAFKNRKEEIMLHLTHRMDEIKKKQSCVQSASTREALHACMPDMGGPGKKGMGKGMGGGMPPGQERNGDNSPAGGPDSQ